MFEYNKNNLLVKVNFSIAGLATNIVIIDKSLNFPKGLLVDLGDGATRDIFVNNFKYEWFNDIILTHGHFDHMGSLYSFLCYKRFFGKGDEIRIIYPVGAFQVENTVKLFQNQYPKANFQIKLIAMSTEKILETKLNSNITIKSFPVSHYEYPASETIPTKVPACGYQIRIQNQNKTMAFSGDTGPIEILYDIYSSEVDFGFIESTYPNDNYVKDKIQRIHLTDSEAKIYSKNCKQAILIHKLPVE